MAIYRCEVKNISRGQGRSCVAAAAYRHGDKLRDERQQMTHCYDRKQGIEHSEIVAPDDAPDWTANRERLWNVIDGAEKRKDARTAKEVLLALPRELTPSQQVEAVREFCRTEFTAKSLVADFAIHAPDDLYGEKQPHAHIMVTTRALDGQGLAKAKEGSLDKPMGIEALREAWATHCNKALERAGLGERVDHRSLKAQRAEALAIANDNARPALERQLAEIHAAELNRQPEPKIGPVGTAIARKSRYKSLAFNDVRSVRAERERLHDLAGELRQVVTDQAREMAHRIAASVDQVAALWRRAEAAMERQRQPAKEPPRLQQKEQAAENVWIHPDVPENRRKTQQNILVSCKERLEKACLSGEHWPDIIRHECFYEVANELNKSGEILIPGSANFSGEAERRAKQRIQQEYAKKEAGRLKPNAPAADQRPASLAQPQEKKPEYIEKEAQYHEALLKSFYDKCNHYAAIARDNLSKSASNALSNYHEHDAARPEAPGALTALFGMKKYNERMAQWEAKKEELGKIHSDLHKKLHSHENNFLIADKAKEHTLAEMSQREREQLKQAESYLKEYKKVRSERFAQSRQQEKAKEQTQGRGR